MEVAPSEDIIGAPICDVCTSCGRIWGVYVGVYSFRLKRSSILLPYRVKRYIHDDGAYYQRLFRLIRHQ